MLHETAQPHVNLDVRLYGMIVMQVTAIQLCYEVMIRLLMALQEYR